MPASPMLSAGGCFKVKPLFPVSHNKCLLFAFFTAQNALASFVLLMVLAACREGELNHRKAKPQVTSNSPARPILGVLAAMFPARSTLGSLLAMFISLSAPQNQEKTEQNGQ
jgi:hypothetical protein